MKKEVTSKHLQGITDLTLLAQIKPGLIDTLDTRTYTTRLKLLMKTLNSLRSSTREFSAFRPFSDGAERIRTIHSLRLAIIESGPDQKLLLAVTFDQPWEPYIRVIWRDVGTLLDIIFCNCKDYVPAYNHSCAEYFAWVRKHQVDAQFFYNAAPITVDDLQYLRRTERLHRETPGSDASDQKAVRLIVDDPEEVALRTACSHRHTSQTAEGEETTEKIGLKALSALYRLTDVYPADRDDGGYLLRAARDILKEFRILDTEVLFPKNPPADERKRFGTQLTWFESDAQLAPAVPTVKERAHDPANVQGGILTSYPGVTHGCLVLMSVTDAAAAREFLAKFSLTTEQAVEAVPPGKAYFNVALSCVGLRRLGVAEAELDRWPKEFREGMEARADLLGDSHANHPRNWALPARNWPSGNRVGAIAERVELSSVDIVVQLRIASAAADNDYEIVDNPAHPLYEEVVRLARLPGLRVLSVQAMRRNVDPVTKMAREHFGFLDGISQPEIGPPPAAGGTPDDVCDGDSRPATWPPAVSGWNNNVARGELLLGYRNSNGDAPGPNPLLDDGTFLVVRKLRQDVAALNRFLEANARQLPADQLKAKMMGRTPDGEALADPGHPLGNDFDYSRDKDGAKCPFQAHIRRANPRTVDKPKVPRILRRGMSYGRKFDEKNPDDAERKWIDRGLIFMAYNASIAEQFEVIQRWISGGNSTGVFSGQSDPLLGVPQTDDPRTFRFANGNCPPVRVPLDVPGAAPFVQLEWGAYLFVPSAAALKIIAALSDAAVSSEAEAGEKIVQALLEIERKGAPADQVVEDWKARLEDFDSKVSGDTAAVWAAIREKHGGALRTAYGVLVASAALVSEVFENAAARYSVKGYRPKMRDTIGESYLGLDDGQDYRSQSGEANRAIMSIKEEEAFKAARRETAGYLNILIGANEAGEASFDTRELSDAVLGRLSNAWFDLPDGDNVAGGGWNWNPVPPRAPQCPGDFTSPSRFLFSPNPGAGPKRYAEMHGQALRRAALDFVRQCRASDAPQGVLSSAFFGAIADDDQLARTLIGAMMGFLPTVDGSLRSVLYDWMDDKTLWRLQESLLSEPAQDAYGRVQVLREPLMRAIQRRPVPDLVWRTVVKEHQLGPVGVKVDDTIVVGIISATNENLAKGEVGVFPVFGGNRDAATHPTHACPAYKMAMGVLLGIFSALLEAGTLRPTPSPTGLTLIGRRAGVGLMNLAAGQGADTAPLRLTPGLRRVTDSEL